jgi:hypothetical protein
MKTWGVQWTRRTLLDGLESDRVFFSHHSDAALVDLTLGLGRAYMGRFGGGRFPLDWLAFFW